MALGGAAGAFVSRVAGPRAPKTAAQRRRRLVRNRWAVARVLSANPALRLQRGGVAAQAPSDYDWAADEQRHHLDANCRLDDGKGHARTIATLIDEQHAIIAEGSRSERLTSERTSERQDVAPPVAPRGVEQPRRRPARPRPGQYDARSGWSPRMARGRRWFEGAAL